MPADDTFVPARSKAEAVARLYALAGAAPEPLGPGSTEKKSVLVELVRRFDLPVDVDARKPEVGRQIAESFGVSWTADDWSRGSTITLHGLNALLEAATEHATLAARPTGIEAQLAALSGLAGFVPARSKLEAVNRISALTRSGPQELGPGSKERKSVLTDLAAGLGLPVNVLASKVDLGAALARGLDVPWTAHSYSRGYTITLIGLNALLAGAERRLGVVGTSLADRLATPADEAELLLAALADAIPTYWDGRTCVLEMLDAEFAAWRQTEWIGWYFEYSGMSALINTFGGAPRRVLNTTFDYALRSTWDLKAHSDGASHDAILNDLDAVDACLADGGLGFIVLTGRPDFSDAADFDTWHRSLRGAGPAHDRSRRLKSAFTPLRLDAFHLADRAALVEQRARGAFSTMIQGRQPDGSPRKPKLKIRLDVAASPGGCRVATRDLQPRTP